MDMDDIWGRVRVSAVAANTEAVENTLSEGVDDAWTQRYFSARADNTGNMSLFFHYQRLALSLVGMGGRLL